MDKDALLAEFQDKRSAALFLGVSPTTLYDWLRQGELPRNCRDRAITAYWDAGLEIPESWLIPEPRKTKERRRAAREKGV